MKVFNVFAQIFAIFAFLTLGSLLMIVALHIIAYEDAVLNIQELYASPGRSFQTAVVGIVFIMVGLYFAKRFVKQGRETEALIFQSEIGPIIVSVTAIEDVAKKVLKRFHLVKEGKIKTLINGKNVEIKMRLVLWSGGRVPELVSEIQEEVRARVKKLTSADNRVEVTCDVQKIEDHEADLNALDSSAKAASV